MKYNILILLCACLAVSCGSDSQKHDTGNGNVAEIKVSQAMEMPVDDISGYVEWTKIIPLETCEGAIFSVHLTIKLSSNHIYVMDLMHEDIFIFDMTGKFLNKLVKGNGPGEILQARDFAVDENDGCLYVNDLEKLVKYSSEGQYLATYYYSEESIYNQFVVEHGNIIGSYIKPFSDSMFVVSTDTTFSAVDKTFIGKANFRQSSVGNVQQTDSGVIVSKPFKKDIYCFSEGSVFQKYQINTDFPDDDCSVDKGPKSVKQVVDESKLKYDYVFVGYCYMGKRFQAFDFMTTDNGFVEVLRNSSTGSLLAHKPSSDDYLCIQGVGDYEDDVFFCWANSERIIGGSNPNNLISEADMEKLKSVKPDDNPIIVLFKLKSEI